MKSDVARFTKIDSISITFFLRKLDYSFSFSKIQIVNSALHAPLGQLPRRKASIIVILILKPAVYEMFVVYCFAVFRYFFNCNLEAAERNS